MILITWPFWLFSLFAVFHLASGQSWTRYPNLNGCIGMSIFISILILMSIATQIDIDKILIGICAGSASIVGMVAFFGWLFKRRS